MQINRSLNRNYPQSESRHALVANDLLSLTQGIENADVYTKLLSNEEMSAEEQLRLSFIFALGLRNREFEYFQYVIGLLDEETRLLYRHVIQISHSHGRGRVWWNEIGRGIVDPEFAELVDELLVNAQPDETYERMTTWAVV
jgi:hypothetical protein